MVTTKQIMQHGNDLKFGIDVIQVGSLFVHCFGILDFFEESTLTIDQYLHTSQLGIDPVNKWELIISSIIAVSKHGFWENDLRVDPRVAYDIISDSAIFIFKIDNNGTTFIVSNRLMKELYDY